MVKAYLFWSPVLLANIHLLLREAVVDGLNNGLLLLELLHLHGLSTTGGLLADSLKRLSNKLQILDSQLVVDDLKITDWVDITLDVDNLGIVEAADNLEDGIDGTNVRQESVSETGTGGGTSGQTGDIIDSQVGWNLGSGLETVELERPIPK